MVSRARERYSSQSTRHFWSRVETHVTSHAARVLHTKRLLDIHEKQPPLVLWANSAL